MIVVGTGQQPMQLRRVEVEVHPDWLDALEPIVEQLRMSCGLQPARLSKFEAGLLALGEEIPGTPDLGPTDDFRHLHHGRGRLRRPAAPARRGARQGARHPARGGPRGAARHAGGHPPPARRLLALRGRAARPGPDRSGTSSVGWHGCSAPCATSTCNCEVWRTWRRPASPTATSVPTSTAATRWPTWPRSSSASARQPAPTCCSGLDSVRWDRLVKGLTVMAQQGPARRSLATREPAVIGLPDLVLARHDKVAKAAKRAKRSGRRVGLPRPAHPVQASALRPRVQQRRLRRAAPRASCASSPCCRTSSATCRTPRWRRSNWPHWPPAMSACPPPPSSSWAVSPNGTGGR